MIATMIRQIRFLMVVLLLLSWLSTPVAGSGSPAVDFTGYHPDCGVAVRRDGDRIIIEWPMEKELAQLVLDLAAGRPLIRSMAITRENDENARVLLENADPTVFLLVGSRQAPADRPPGMSDFNVFFDTPANRSFQTFASRLETKRVRVIGKGFPATVAIGDLSIGPFTGELRVTVYRGTRLVHIEAVVHTAEDRRAILYDAGLALSSLPALRFAWVDTEGKLVSAKPAQQAADNQVGVRHRAVVAQTDNGSIVCFPPPHQYFSPRDLTDNLKTVWYGRGHRALDDRFGFGIRQAERGGGSWVPWFNAPPGSEQRLGVFYLLSSGNAEKAIEQTLRYTHGDRFPKLPGYHTFTSHWHMAITDAAIREKASGRLRSTPDFVGMFKAMGVDIVHLAEFHGDGHPGDPGPVRLPEMNAMFDECERLSGPDILFLPGEEANSALGRGRPGKESGHWMYLFPKPVYWTMKREPGQSPVENVAPYGTVFRIRDGADMQVLLEREGGLAWTSHARIKGSSWTPDIFRNEPFYRSDHWLGAAWKAMPADLSHDRLGRRALDLLDDMANWGQQKYLPGEVDVFKIDHTHELYGHMNVNYVRLEPDRVPSFREGWQPVVNSLRSGQFFVTTGEVLIPGFTVNGQGSGSTLKLESGKQPEVKVELKWTFPLKFVELISGDGSRVFRERIDLSDTGPFDGRSLRLTPELNGRTWARLEAWDIAGNGAFTQPVWLRSAGK
jgi:hypothetical protein